MTIPATKQFLIFMNKNDFVIYQKGKNLKFKNNLKPFQNVYFDINYSENPVSL